MSDATLDDSVPTLLPTLASMRFVYGLSPTGGPQSPRFREYLRRIRAGESALAAFNPMTSADVLATISQLEALSTEAIVLECALAVGGSFSIAVAVCTPGLWTDRLTTEMEHRLDTRRRSGRCWLE